MVIPCSMSHQLSRYILEKMLAHHYPGETVDTLRIDYEEKTHKELRPVPTSAYSCHIYPNGEFGVGYIPVPKKTTEDSRQDRGEVHGRIITEVARTHELVDGTVLIDSTDLIQVSVPKLGIPLESSQTKKKYGLKGITSHGRKMLRNGGHCLDVAFRHRRGYLPQMGTLTVPSLSPDRMRVMCQRWGDIVRRFFQECKRKYKKLGMPFHYCCCTEIQPGRWEERREVGLHLHFLFIAKRIKGDWSMPDQWVRDTWRRVITKYVGDDGVPENLNYRRDTVKQSSAAYLAKYASKGTEFIKEVAEEVGEDCIPSQWWSMSASLRHCIHKCTYSSRGSQAELLLHICRHELDEYLRFVRVATITEEWHNKATGALESRERIIGYGGLLDMPGRRLFQPADMNACIKLLLPSTLDKLSRS